MEKTVYLDLLEFLKNLREQRYLQLPPSPAQVFLERLDQPSVQELVVLVPSNKRKSSRRKGGGRSAKQI
jgi:hypothetical protein